MRQAAQRGAGLTRQLLTFSRRSDLKPEPIDLALQIGGMRELLDRSLGGDVHVELDFEAGLWPVEVDPGELELVVLNLAVNARDAMSHGGTIVIRAENVADPHDEDGGECVRLSVVDEGSGMSDEVKAHVFEPFYTTKDVGRGSGLGLAQVHGFAQQSGGSVRIESALGEGTTVSVLLPRSARSPVRRAPHLANDNVRERRVRTSGSVLLVEDDDEVAALVTEMLEELGYEVTRTASAAAALGALSNGRAIDLVFSDIMMPGGMNGVELARELRSRRRNLPVLLTSGYEEAARAGAKAEGVRILAKPYRLDELATALAAITTH
jgi:CheY-like chemotaxis protein